VIVADYGRQQRGHRLCLVVAVPPRRCTFLLGARAPVAVGPVSSRAMIHPLHPRARNRLHVSSSSTTLIQLIQPIHTFFAKEFPAAARSPVRGGTRLQHLYSNFPERRWIRWISWIRSNMPMGYAIHLFQVIQWEGWIAL
jgi:hypothetical protein